MAERLDKGNEESDDSSSSDDDSISLLQDAGACHREGAAGDTLATGVSHAGNKERREGTDALVSLFKAPEAGTSSCSQSKSTAATSSRSGNALPCLLTPKQLHKRDERGETRLHKACKRGDLAQVKALIRAGISVNMEDYAGWTALHEACAAGGQSMVEELLRAGANVNARSCDGVTPLHDAVLNGNYQVVTLLLQSGSNASDKNYAGLSALDMADDEQIKQLLSTFQHEQPGNDRTTASRARVASETEPRRKDDILDSPSHSEGIASMLKDVSKQQSELATCLPTGPKDAGGFYSAVKRIQSVLSELLIKQRLEKDKLAKKYRNMSDRLRQRVLRRQLLSLASTQRDLMETLRRQKRLVDSRSAVRTDPPAQPGGGRVGQEPGHCSQSEEASSRPVEATAENLSLKGKRKDTPRGAKSEDGSGRLSKLVQAGVTPAGSILQMRLKGQWHHAHVLANGSIKSKSKVHQAPEDWLKSILGNIPVSPAYAWHKVTFMDRPLSFHMQKLEDGGSVPPERSGDCVEDRRATSSQEMLTTEAAWLNLLMKIKIIHLVDDDERLPNALMDRYWEKLLRKDLDELDDWTT